MIIISRLFAVLAQDTELRGKKKPVLFVFRTNPECLGEAVFAG
jgi:hypothetical protein